MSKNMVNDGYEKITNINISLVVMRKKHEHMHQLKYLQMDASDMSFFPNDSFDGVIDKGTLDSLLVRSIYLQKYIVNVVLISKCGVDAPISVARMLAEVCRLLKPGGIYMLVTIRLMMLLNLQNVRLSLSLFLSKNRDK
ncbi:hypothetical protein Dimus_029532 [Dionaea muscipula]